MKLQDLEALVASFIGTHQFKINSVRAYKVDLAYFIRYMVAERLNPASVTKHGVLSWLKQFSSRARHRRGVNIRRFLLWLKDVHNIAIDPEFCIPWKFREECPLKPDSPADLNAEQIALLLQNRSLTSTMRAVFALIFCTGATLEELAALTWKDVSLGNLPYITIGEDVRHRVIPLDKPSADVLLTLRRVARQRNQEDHEAVFVQSRQPKPLTAAYMSILIRKQARRILGRQISSTELIELARNLIVDKNGITSAREIIGIKNGSALVKPDRKRINIERLREIHRSVFART